MGTYEYSNFNEFNRFSNLDSIEGKIIAHLLDSNTKHANIFWKILKYDTKDALAKPDVSKEERIKLIDGYNADIYGGQTENTRLFLSPFSDDAWAKETSSVYIYVNDIFPTDATRATVSVKVETVIHSKINALYGDADLDANPTGTNPNDYYKDSEQPTVQYKSRASVLLKSILAEINGLYIDGVGYLSFNSNKNIEGERVRGKATMSLFNTKSFFGHAIEFSVTVSGCSGDAAWGY